MHEIFALAPFQVLAHDVFFFLTTLVPFAHPSRGLFHAHFQRLFYFLADERGIVPVGLAAAADTQLKVDVGWGGHTPGNRWIPVFVTASDSRTRNVTLLMEWPGGGQYSMRIEQYLTIGPEPRTFPLLVPIHGYSRRGCQLHAFRCRVG